MWAQSRQWSLLPDSDWISSRSRTPSPQTTLIARLLHWQIVPGELAVGKFQDRRIAANAGLVDFQPAVAAPGDGAGPGAGPADQVVDVAGAGSPIDQTGFPGHHADCRGAAMVLRPGRQAAVQPAGDGIRQHFRAESGQDFAQLAGIDVFRYRDAALQQDIPGIHPFIHQHDGHAGFPFAADDAPLDRRGAAVGRQQRGMDVQAAQGRDAEDVGRQKAPVSGGHDHVRLQGADVGFELRGADLVRLQDRQVPGQGQLLHRRRNQPEVPSLRPVRLADHAHDRIAVVQQLLQGQYGKFRRSHVEYPGLHVE